MYRQGGGVWCPYWGFGAFLGLCWGFGIGGRGSSVKLPFYDVGRHVKKMRCEDHGDPEWVAIPQEGQKVGGSGLTHR
jgi:hypothetical protein